ncbi:putative odorant receptor 92a isoform X3 [Ooceraea biroi]|uniref:putative odorant receptor 92a isoform X3 n=1 Tax=Ooceraea biroi TaxID=2015173 RepID=UPI0005BDDC6D|nr:putative odorant receptor 92a isoform X3 [Ooceraea biroi]
MKHQVQVDEEYDKLIRPILVISKLIAVWPLKEDRPFSATVFRICHVVFLLFMLLSMSIAMTIHASYKMDDVDEMTELILSCCVCYLSLIRVVVFSIHQKEMLYVIETMRNDWIGSSYEERAILRNKCLFAYRLAKCFITMVMGIATLFALEPIFKTASPIFECLYFLDTIAGLSTVCTISSATSFNLVAVIHGSAKFAILQRRLETVNRNDPDIDRVIVNCIRRHQDAIAFADALESVLNLLALGQFVLSIGLVCFAGFQITSMLQNKVQCLKYSGFLCATILELFMFSSSGNELIIESDAVSESAYRSDWIGGTFSRSLHIMMIRSRIPSRVTVGKFCDVSLRSFTQVLSTSFSYLMVLLTAMSEE